METFVNKAALGELTFGEVWSLVKDRVSSVRVEDSTGVTTFSTFRLVPRVSLGLSNSSDPEATPEYSISLDVKVKVKEDHIELSCEDWFGDMDELSIYFLFQPEPEVVSLGFLLPGASR